MAMVTSNPIRPVLRATAMSALMALLLGATGVASAPVSVTARSSNIMDMAYPCGLTNPAFCDNFSEGATANAGREGALNPARWSYTRFTQNVNPGQGVLNEFVPTDAQHCKTLLHNVLPDNDSFMCGLEVPEPNHWMEAFDDNGYATVTDAMIRQPFDFTSRTGTIQFGVDAKTDGPHTWWTEVIVSDQPVPSPHDGPTLLMHPRNGVRLAFAGGLDCPGASQPPANDTAGVGVTWVANDPSAEYSNYQQQGVANNLPPNTTTCVKTAPDSTNMIQIRLSTTHADIYMSDAGTNVLRQVASIDLPTPLPFSVGYVHFEHVQYNAGKEGVSSAQTYHWHDMGFDGPIHPALRAYDLPDAMTPRNGGYELGYRVTPTGMQDANYQSVPAFTLSNVDLSNVATASINIGLYNNDTTTTLLYSLNNGPWRSFSNPDGQPAYAWHTLHIPLSLADLRSGTNTLDFRSSNSAATVISQGDLTLNLTDHAYPAPRARTIPCALMQLMMVAMPHMTMLADPCIAKPMAKAAHLSINLKVITPGVLYRTGAFMALVHGATNRTVIMTVAVTLSAVRDTMTGVGDQRKRHRVHITVLLYRTVAHGRTNRKGNATMRVPIHIAPQHVMPATLVVTAAIGHDKFTVTRRIRVNPAIRATPTVHTYVGSAAHR